MDNDALDSQNSNKGGRKLIIMAVISIFITLCLTTISLFGRYLS